MRIDKACELCGCMMRDVDVKKRFCDDCRRIRRQADSRRRAQEVKSMRHYEPPNKRLKRKGNELDRIALAASEAGMSYGKFVALGLDKEKKA